MSEILGKLFLYFIIYAFLGWVLEVIYHLYKQGKLVNRGFLNGPVCPIYGFGAVIMLLVLDNLIDKPFYVFIIGAIVASLLELVTGYVLEKLFQVRWWDYSNMKYNIGGYVSLLFSFYWGIGSVILAEVLHPLVVNFVGLFSRGLVNSFLSAAFIVINIDAIVTLISLLEFRKIIRVLKETKSEFSARLDENARITKLKDQLEEKEVVKIFERKMLDIMEYRSMRYRSIHKKFLRAYPNLIPGEIASRIQEIIFNRRK